ncbi:hypothetical protein [Nesterenkonia haasae]|uniref:hypothetical protein n=1 Tax=Nesterenkonia haasae TaxID=2587813 RepID=UPI00139117F6|nr:hypothetical protein [Nesterenkonia haasae]NDK31162.1 hypothetical protein [Nesterenkonia haasae]
MSIFDSPTMHWHADLPTPESLTRKSVEAAPYVRVALPDRTVDAKARAWNRDVVLIRWVEGKDEQHSAWVPAAWCARISRDESNWQDVYDQTANGSSRERASGHNRCRYN